MCVQREAGCCHYLASMPCLCATLPYNCGLLLLGEGEVMLHAPIFHCPLFVVLHTARLAAPRWCSLRRRWGGWAAWRRCGHCGRGQRGCPRGWACGQVSVVFQPAPPPFHPVLGCAGAHTLWSVLSRVLPAVRSVSKSRSLCIALSDTVVCSVLHLVPHPTFLTPSPLPPVKGRGWPRATRCAATARSTAWGWRRWRTWGGTCWSRWCR